MHRKDHPIQIINKAFKKYFTRQYGGYVSKGTQQSVDSLCKIIERATDKLRSDYSTSSNSTNSTAKS